MKSTRVSTPAPVWERFWLKVQRGANEECWPFQGAVDGSGYGVFQLGVRTERTHRLAWLLAGGDLQPGDFVCHTCDNPPCCNPRHLFRADHNGNMLDARIKGRINRGSKNFHAELTEPEVEDIKRELMAGTRQVDLAQRYGVCSATIWNIAHNKTWRHVVV